MTWIDKPIQYKDTELRKKEAEERKIRQERIDKGRERLKYTGKCPPKYKSYINRANQKRLPFTLSIIEFNSLMSASCLYCGGSGGTIDRVESSEGYEIENCVPSCARCNMMKYTSSQYEFYRHIAKIYNHLTKSGRVGEGQGVSFSPE